jgi:glycosyltransferase involved in cell wall biosynthesis
MNFILTTYNRPDYLRKSLYSLKASPFTKDDTLWIFDDASDDGEAIDLINCFKLPRAKDVHLFRTKKNVGCDINSYHALTAVYSHTKDPFIFMAETDGVYIPGWLPFLKRAYKLAKDSDDIGMISLFNTPSHPVKEEYDKDFDIKKSLGGFASLIDCRDLKSINPNKNPFNWDWEFQQNYNKNKLKLLCSKKTYVQHIGAHGTHSKGSGHDIGINEAVN